MSGYLAEIILCDDLNKILLRPLGTTFSHFSTWVILEVVNMLIDAFGLSVLSCCRLTQRKVALLAPRRKYLNKKVSLPPDEP